MFLSPTTDCLAGCLCFYLLLQIVWQVACVSISYYILVGRVPVFLSPITYWLAGCLCFYLLLHIVWQGACVSISYYILFGRVPVFLSPTTYFFDVLFLDTFTDTQQ